MGGWGVRTDKIRGIARRERMVICSKHWSEKLFTSEKGKVRRRER
jgi:hypothetical protein